MVKTGNLAASSGNGEVEVDRISMLPTDIIHYIMSFLDTEYAVQTCVLSKRWINIWKSLPFLNFDMCDSTVEEFNDVIDGVFMLRDDCDIQWFRLEGYYFDTGVTTSVSRWIDTAVKRNVQEVTLELYKADAQFTYQIPGKLLNSQSLKKLTLISYKTYVNIILPISMNLPQLKFMSLGGIIVSNEELTTRLFSSCPLLETLEIDNCDLQTHNQGNFTVKSLVLKRYAYTHRHERGSPNIIMLSAPNLSSFTCNYANKYKHLSTEEKQVNAKCIGKLLVAVAKVERLDLSPAFIEDLMKAIDLFNWQLPCLHNLHRLKLKTWCTGGSLRVIAYLLTMSPNIKTLILKLKESNSTDVGNDWETKFAVPCMLSHLKFVQIEEMVGCDAELKFLRFLLKNSKVLEEVDLFFSAGVGSPDTVREVKRFKNKLITLPTASSNVKIVVF